MKKITFLISLLFVCFYANSQTALTAGDIAFVGSNSDGATNADDTVAFVLLKDIDAATTIIFTDMGWNDATGFFAVAGDSEFTWTSGIARTAGEVVTIDMAGLLPAAYSSIGDQLFAIQGSTAAPIFIAGLQFNDATGDDANWDGSAISNTTSALPNALITGTTAVRLVPEQDNWQFSCALAGGPVSGTPAQIRALVNDRANWVSNNDTPYIPTLEAGCTFTISGGGDTIPPVITCAPTPAPITAGIDGMAAIPDLVTGTTATDNVSIPANITITQSPTAGTMVGVGVHSVVLTATDEAGNSAACSINVTINEPPFTTLAPGDIAFVGFNTDGNDGFAFIILKDIIAGTNIKFTDCGVSNPNTITCIGGGDGSATWYSPSAMSAGDIVTLPGSFMSGSIISSTGDQLFAYQGTAASPNFITGIHGNVDPGVTNDADWDTGNTSSTTTALPDQLTNGVNAIRVYVAGAPETEVDNWQFDCSSVPGGVPITGTAAQISAIINDIQYWVNNDATEFVPTANSGCSYSVILTLFTAPADLCINAGVQTSLGGGTPTGGVYSGPGVTDDGNGLTYSFDPAVAGVGIHILTYTENGNSATDDVEVFALDDASFSYGAASYCADAVDPTPTITGLGGGTFTSVPAGLSINASTGAIDVSASTPGAYTVTYTTSGTCPNSSGVSVTINALDDASFNYGAASYCVSASDPTPTITGLGGGTFTSGAGLSINAGTGTIDVSASTPGAYTVTYTTSGTCPNSSGVSVTINALDDASFNYGAASYCVSAADPTPTITGLGGGTFTSVPAGLSINASTGAIDVSASTPGAYTVTYTTSGTCPNSSGVSVTINALDDASFNYGAASYCVSAADPTPTITGLGGGTFTSGAGLSINAGTGTIDVSASTPGAYTVTYTTSGTCPNSSGVSVTINALDDASFNYGAATYCVDAVDPTPTITGLGGGTFTSAPAGLSINAATGTIDVSASTPGTYTITYTTAGVCSNSSSVSVTINALDDASFSYSAAAYCVDESDPTPTITGLGGGTFTSGAGLSINAGTGTIDVSASIPGAYTVTYTTSGTCPNSSGVSVTINALPTVTFSAPMSPVCPSAVLTGQGGGSPIGGVYSGPGVTDDGNGMTYTFDAGAAGNGTHILTYTFSDANGCTNSASDSVTVEDTEPPVANCAAPFTIQLDVNGMASIVLADIENGSTDNCGVGSTSIDITDFDCSNVGPNTVTLTVTDVNGNVSTCTTIVTVEDNIPPTITCPGDITVSNDPGVCGAVVNYTVTADDNCSGVMGSQTFSYTGTIDSFVVPAGVTSVTIEARGAAGGYTASSAVFAGKGAVMQGDFNVTPGSTLKILVGENNNAGNGGGGGTFLTDAVNTPLIIAGGGGGASGAVDSPDKHGQIVTTGGTGASGGGTGGSAGNGGNVGAPFASGAGGGLLTDGADGWTAGSGGKSFVNGGAGANVGFGIGGFGGGGNGSGNQVGGGGGGYSGGGSGSNSTGGGVGGGGASFNSGTNQVNTTGDVDGNSGNGLVTISWNTSITFVQTAGLPSGSTFPIGTTTNTFVVTDASGNTATCSFDVTVNDTEVPEITCPGNITQNNDPGFCGAVITYTAPIGTDNCPGSTTAQTAGLASGSTFPVGTTTNTFVTTDASGNTATCSFDVIINDNEAPVANCAAPFTIQLDVNGMASITVADIENGSIDNCAVASTSIDITDFDCSDVGPNTVTLTVTDVNGNSSTCTTVVTVEDNVAPVANCAAPFTIQLDANGNASITVADIENGSTDACGIASTSIDITDFTCADVGPNTVTLTVTDVNGNVSTCTTIVTVEDSIPPTIACPADITVNTDAGDCFATVSFSMPIVFDNCGVDSVVQTMGDPSGSQFPVGINTIEFTATDVNGNVSTCSFTITVIDNEAPVAVCQNITIQLDEFGNASIVAADVDGGSTDQCGVASITIDIDTFDCSDVGDNNVILTVTDVNGNSSSCTAIVTVEDVTAPVVACQNITVELDPVTGTVTIAGTDIDNGSTDACGIVSYDLDIDTFDCSNIGDNTVVLTITDVNGNTATCTAIVTVEDNTSPVLVCQDFTIEIGADGTATLDPSDVIASNDDACGILTVAVDITEFTCADIGTPVTVQVFSQDNNGNLSTCTATVTAVDLLAPVITCPLDQTVDPGVGNLFYILPDYFANGEATAIDNCTDPVTITSQDPAPGTPLADGTYTITLTATDEYGNTSTCDFELVVESVLGTGDNNQSLGSIAMYPVPAKNILNISNPQNIELEGLEIYDLRGRLVQTANLRGMGTVKPIDVHQLAAAVYYIKIKGKYGEITKRLLKE